MICKFNCLYDSPNCHYHKEHMECTDCMEMRYQELKQTQYKIETLVKGNWEDDAIGTENTFETLEAAEEQIPELARIFDAPVDEFRVVERLCK